MQKFSKSVLVGKQNQEVNIQKSLFKFENKSCYVLITCGEPSKDGHMEIEMSYEGDPVLAAYLVESAQNIIDEQLS